MSITIIADDRESNGANPYFDKFIIADNAQYSKKPKKAGGGNIKLCVNRVTTGDYNIILNDGPKQIISMIIERKTWKDLAASFKDGRAKNQHKGMLSVQARTGCMIMYLIEGRITYDKNTKVNRIAFLNLDAKRRHLIIQGNQLIQTKDQEHTAEMIVNLARDLWRMYQAGKITFEAPVSNRQAPTQLTKESYEHELRVLQSKYGIASSPPDTPNKTKIKPLIPLTDIIVDDVNIDDIVDDVTAAGGSEDVSLLANIALLDVHSEVTDIPAILTERKIKDNVDIIERMWQAIPGISSKSAPQLMEKYQLSELISANDMQKKHLLKEIAELKYASGRRLGDDMAKKIMVLAYAGTGVTIIDKLKTISANILAEIPGVTKDTAKKILTQYSLRDICIGRVGEDELSVVKKSATRKLGTSLAEKIIELLA
jgi:ERCC4-type nuclease